MVVLYFTLCIVFIIKEKFLVLCEHNSSDFQKKISVYFRFFSSSAFYTYAILPWPTNFA